MNKVPVPMLARLEDRIKRMEKDLDALYLDRLEMSDFTRLNKAVREIESLINELKEDDERY